MSHRSCPVVPVAAQLTPSGCRYLRRARSLAVRRSHQVSRFYYLGNRVLISVQALENWRSSITHSGTYLSLAYLASFHPLFSSLGMEIMEN